MNEEEDTGEEEIYEKKSRRYNKSRTKTLFDSNRIARVNEHHIFTVVPEQRDGIIKAVSINECKTVRYAGLSATYQSRALHGRFLTTLTHEAFPRCTGPSLIILKCPTII